MALHERAELLTTPDAEPAEPPARPDAAKVEVDEVDVDGDGAWAVDDVDTTEEPERATRKRTARQRMLLVSGNGADDGAAMPVDPLLAVSALVTDAEVESERDEPPDEEDAAAVSAEAAPSIEAEPATDDPTTVAVPVTAVGVAAATITLEPPPTSPIPMPVMIPDGPGQLAPTVAPAPPVVVPPPPRPQRRARPRVRKVTRVVRSVDAWSVFKVALIFFAAMGVVIVTAGVLLWNLAQSTGTLDNVEGFFREAFNYDTFKLNSGPLFHALLTLTALFVVAGTGMAVVMAVLFNLIADLTGGIRVTVLEREVVARDDPRAIKRRRVTRAPAGRSRGAAPPPPPSVPG